MYRPGFDRHTDSPLGLPRVSQTLLAYVAGSNQNRTADKGQKRSFAMYLEYVGQLKQPIKPKTVRVFILKSKS